MNIQLDTVLSFHQLGQRGNQEDCRYPDSDRIDTSQRFFIVCDGVGGCDKGEVASATVCRAMGQALADTDFLHRDFTNADFRRALDAAYNALDDIADADNADMGTTLTFAAFHAGGCTLAHIGDSRIYQVRPADGIVYRSDDHSLVNQLVHSGLLSPEEAEHHPQSNVITRHMGPVAEDEQRCNATVMRSRDVQPGDCFLLCTDGVLHQWDDHSLTQLLCSDISGEEKIRRLAAQSAPSSDNNTAILITIHAVENDTTNTHHPTPNTTTDTHRSPKDDVQIEEIESIQQAKPERSFIQRLKGLFTNKQ